MTTMRREHEILSATSIPRLDVRMMTVDFSHRVPTGAPLGSEFPGSGPATAEIDINSDADTELFTTTGVMNEGSDLDTQPIEIDITYTAGTKETEQKDKKPSRIARGLSRATGLLRFPKRNRAEQNTEETDADPIPGVKAKLVELQSLNLSILEQGLDITPPPTKEGLKQYWNLVKMSKGISELSKLNGQANDKMAQQRVQDIQDRLYSHWYSHSYRVRAELDKTDQPSVDPNELDSGLDLLLGMSRITQESPDLHTSKTSEELASLYNLDNQIIAHVIYSRGIGNIDSDQLPELKGVITRTSDFTTLETLEKILHARANMPVFGSTASEEESAREIAAFTSEYLNSHYGHN